MLYGRFTHNVDAKGRLFVPAKLREKLGEPFIAAAVMDRCVCLYAMDEWDKLLAGLAAMPMTKARHLERYLSANAADVTVDGAPVDAGEIYVMVHKPAGVVTATEDRRLPTVADLLPEAVRRRGPGPVGRLDRDVTGLVIMTFPDGIDWGDGESGMTNGASPA